jgi:hypothetical protein
MKDLIPHGEGRILRVSTNNLKTTRFFVMAGLVPAIHAFLA